VAFDSFLQLCLEILFTQTHATFYSFYSSDTVHYKGKGGNPDGKPDPLPYGLRNPYRNLRSENFQEFRPRNLNKIECS
jgi:hypothetical protein